MVTSTGGGFGPLGPLPRRHRTATSLGHLAQPRGVLRGQLARASAATTSFPLTSPGRFMRASLPSPSTSCAGTIASDAREVAASSISPQCGSLGSSPVAARSRLPSASNQPTAVSVSCVLV